MVGVAEQCFSIFGGNARGAQAAPERMTKIMDANQRQPGPAPCLLPAVVVHRTDAPAAIGEDPDRMFAALRFDDRPGNIVKDDDVRTFGLEGFWRNQEHASSDLGYCNLPLPLQPTDDADAEPCADGEERHAREVRR